MLAELATRAQEISKDVYILGEHIQDMAATFENLIESKDEEHAKLKQLKTLLQELA